MQKIKDIYIACEKGLELVAPLAQEAIQEIMDCFPAFKEAYPIKVLGNWKSEHSQTVHNKNISFKPHESIDWYIARAAQQALSDGRARGVKIEKDGRIKVNGQISIDALYRDLLTDPYAKKIPQIQVLLTKHDLYGTQSNGRLLNFCLGVSEENAFSVISTARFIKPNGRFDQEGFKTVVMHEFGHAIGLTRRGRKNTYEQLGSHCADENCIMQQQMNGDFSEITRRRLIFKAHGLPPICPDCITEGEKFFRNHLAKALSRNADFRSR